MRTARRIAVRWRGRLHRVIIPRCKRIGLASAPRFASLSALINLKKQWNVSVSSLVHRLHDVASLTEWHYRTLMVEISTLGYRA